MKGPAPLRLACSALVLFTALRVAAQGPAIDRFGVASIKANTSPQAMINVRTEPGGRFVATNESLLDLIRLAYSVRDFQVVGGPSWMRSDRFDVIARADGELPPFNPAAESGPTERKLQALLAERFRLVVHRETRELPVYNLVPARTDGRLGEKLTASSIDCAAMFAERARSGQQGPVTSADGRPTCGMVISPWSIRVGGAPISQLAMVLSQMTNRLVVDRTGLAGNFDADLQWTPLGMRGRGGDADNPPPIPVPRPDPNGVSLETAIQEQLGLKLEPDRAPVPVLVIDSVEHPTPD